MNKTLNYYDENATSFSESTLHVNFMELHKRFEACYRDNLHSIWAGQELYRKGNSRETFYHILEKNMMPVYDSARRQGYEIWNY